LFIAGTPNHYSGRIGEVWIVLAYEGDGANQGIDAFEGLDAADE
jgi:hypothetical protein